MTIPEFAASTENMGKFEKILAFAGYIASVKDVPVVNLLEFDEQLDTLIKSVEFVSEYLVNKEFTPIELINLALPFIGIDGATSVEALCGKLEETLPYEELIARVEEAFANEKIATEYVEKCFDVIDGKTELDFDAIKGEVSDLIDKALENVDDEYIYLIGQLAEIDIRDKTELKDFVLAFITAENAEDLFDYIKNEEVYAQLKTEYETAKEELAEIEKQITDLKSIENGYYGLAVKFFGQEDNKILITDDMFVGISSVLTMARYITFENVAQMLDFFTESMNYDDYHTDEDYPEYIEDTEEENDNIPLEDLPL